MSDGMAGGLLNADFSQEPTPDELAQKQKEDNNNDSLGQLLSSKFTDWAGHREGNEEEWLTDLRAFEGVYEAAEKAAYETDVFFHLSRTKTRSAYARIIDLLFQGSEKHWGIEKTPVSHIAPEIQQYIIDSFRKNTNQDPSEEEIKEIVENLAEAAAAKMEIEIEDQLTEADYETEAKLTLLEMCMLGTGCIKGAVTKGVEESYWVNQKAGSWNLVTGVREYPDVQAVSIFDVYPDPYALFIKDAEGLFQRHVLTRPQLRDLSINPNFNEDAIEQVIVHNPTGNHVQRQHERELRLLSGYSNDSESGRYEVLEYWGLVQGTVLQAAGIEIAQEDLYSDFHANVWVCGHKTILAEVNPWKPQRIPYNLIPFERSQYSIWGTGVPRSMRDSQKVINAAIRALLDNMAYSSGPMGEVNMDLVAEGEDVKDIRPRKLFKREGGDPAGKMIHFYDVPNYGGPLGAIVDMFKRFADEETMMPSYTHGQQNPGLNKTASGMSMLMSAASINLKPVIKNWDDYGSGAIIKSLYNWNMQYSEKDDIKGDMSIKTKGSTVLIAKEMQSERILQFLQLTANPVDVVLTKRASLLRKAASSLDINEDDVVKSDEDIEAAYEQQRSESGDVADKQPGVASS